MLNLTRNTAYEGLAGWSPDGQQIIYTLAKEIHLMDIDGGEPHTISITEPEDLAGYAWNPLSPRMSLDGTLLAFTAPVPSGPRVFVSASGASNATVGVYVTNADGTDTHRVDSAESAILLAWCP